MRIILSILAALLTGAAVAQEAAEDPPLRELSHDLNGDGRAEVFTLIEQDAGPTDLRVSGTGGLDVTGPALGTSGEGAQAPILALDGQGRVQVTSFHDVEGQTRWTVTLTIDFPDGSYRVAGYRFVWWDQYDPTIFGFCDLDLRAGTGTIQQGAERTHRIDTEIPTLPITLWAETDKVFPVDCS
ncbi:hypothetical protein EU803_09090 [Loktanella sp. IMCC34160]|uniref:hypothetical protein n=1 Tax=Loktanella sp. IMCC34160 TaxID=2510646 RepID=UPI00101E156A|nr:hypothetical protein [Loktanella sp. IMCC34160]RYG91243.1 hypothetical protein EU803_09090 [Loktanella sp. IMCC34160]